MNSKDINKAIDIFKEFNKLKEMVTERDINFEISELVKTMIEKSTTMDERGKILFLINGVPAITHPTVYGWDGLYHNPIHENGIDFPINVNTTTKDEVIDNG